MLVVAIPKAIVTVVVLEIKNAVAMLLVLIPLPFILFAIGELVNAVSLTLPFNIFAFVGISVLKNGFSLSIRLTVH